ncbi:MAG: septum formation inhibitor Maf [Synergistaceae bacterium]|nr:septum formation inhibitor Maf [Synergistaceae bacterium]
MKKIILASGSPRRRELLKDIGIEFEIFKPNVDESKLENEKPEDLCLRLSRLKAKSGAEKFPDSIIIAADTIVVIDGKILGKPHDRNEAFKMLKTLQNREHEVITGLSVASSDKIISRAEHTFVKFIALSDEEISEYISTGECDDKAGAYAIQGIGATLIEKINGDYFNVVGLPLCSLRKILKEFVIRNA